MKIKMLIVQLLSRFESVNDGPPVVSDVSGIFTPATVVHPMMLPVPVELADLLGFPAVLNPVEEGRTYTYQSIRDGRCWLLVDEFPQCESSSLKLPVLSGDEMGTSHPFLVCHLKPRAVHRQGSLHRPKHHMLGVRIVMRQGSKYPAQHFDRAPICHHESSQL